MRKRNLKVCIGLFYLYLFVNSALYPKRKWLKKMKEQTIEFMNEEEIKVKLVLPYLKSLGFKESDIELETKFTIPLGRNSYCISSGKHKKIAAGRLDILCRKGSNNLFLIEAKAGNRKITQKDIEQGVSYASLIRPMPPYVIVTNGKQTKVIDVITNKELNESDIDFHSEFWVNKPKLSPMKELNLRREALKHFISYSSENLKAFSLSQIKDRMQTIKGSINELYKKYIPELFLPRQELIDSFKTFMDSSAKCFAIIGESGVGKTNYICGLVDFFVNDYITMFFNAATFVKDITENIKDDFNWVFSSHLEDVEILRNLEFLTNNGKTKMCIFIDAIDEAPLKDFNLYFDDFIRKLKKFPNIKLCISCKISEWHKFLMISGNPSNLPELVYPKSAITNKSFSISNDFTTQQAKKTLPGYIIRRFDEDEMKIVENKYKNIFKFDGKLTGNLKYECKLGFMLRVLSEVYQDKKLPEVVDNVELLEKYIEKKLCKFREPNKAKRYLQEIGKILIDKDIANHGIISGKISEFELRRKLQLSIEDQIPLELFSFNILTKTLIEGGIILIGFYYSRIQDFVISILSLRLPTLNRNEFVNLLPKMFTGSVGQSAIAWYASIAKEEHTEILMKYKEARALIFLSEYTKIIETNFPKLKEQFEPYTSGKVGLAIGEIRDSISKLYSFIAPKNNDQKIIKTINASNEEELWRKYIGLELYFVKSKSEDFISIDPKIAASIEVKEQLAKMLQEGRLNEDNSIGLAIEKAIATLYHFGRKLGFSINKSHVKLPQREDFLPVDCDDLLKRIDIFFARYYYKHKQIEDYIQKEIFKTAENGGISIDTSLLDYEEINRNAEIAVKENQSIPKPNIQGDFPPFLSLYKAVKVIKKETIKTIDLLLPPPDYPHRKIDQKFLRKQVHLNASPFLLLNYSDSQLKKFFKKFFTLFIEEYNKLIQTCFPTYSSQFPFYSSQPITFYVEISTKKPFNQNLKYGYKTFQRKNEIIVEVNPKISKLDFDKSEFKDIHHWASLNAIFTAPSIPIDTKLNTQMANEMCILRSWVYQQIAKEMCFEKI